MKKNANNAQKAIWSWNYNYGKPYPWPCRRCGALVVMEKIGYRSKTMHVRCPECNYEEKRSD